MKNKSGRNPFLFSFALFLIFVLFITAIAIGLFYYIFSIPKPEGLSPASWPQRFTDNFSVWINEKDKSIEIEKTGLSRLDEYGLWIQVIDESGQEIFSYHKPGQYPESYTASALTALGMGAYEHGNTVFVSRLDDSYCYIIGFPYAIGKYMLYYDGERVTCLLPAAKIIVFSALSILAVLFFGYVFLLSRKLSSITDGIRNVSARSFTPRKEKGMFSDIYAALNQMDTEIRKSDQIKEETERMRQEWIANITHDLKTPLSPVKGYAELLVRTGQTDTGTVREYGKIILKNVSHVEKLLNDLKLTYQLESGAAPYNPAEVPVTRYLKELVIDIINDPAFSNRKIEFESSGQELSACLDPDLFRRAVQNIIINAMVHNPPDTKIKISVKKGAKNTILISIHDNGTGMKEAELAELFNRYYRGTSTRIKPEGSGLGLAIAKQILLLHGGEIRVKSSPGMGTQFLITLPAET